MFATLSKRVEHGSELTRETAAAALFLSRGELELSRLTYLWTVARSLMESKHCHHRLQPYAQAFNTTINFSKLINTFLYVFVVLAMLGYI